MHKAYYTFKSKSPHEALEKFSQIVKKYKLHKDTQTVYSNDTFRAEIMKDGDEFAVLLEKWEEILDYETEKFTAQLRLRHYAKNIYPDLEISRNQAN